MVSKRKQEPTHIIALVEYFKMSIVDVSRPEVLTKLRNKLLNKSEIMPIFHLTYMWLEHYEET